MTDNAQKCEKKKTNKGIADSAFASEDIDQDEWHQEGIDTCKDDVGDVGRIPAHCSYVDVLAEK